MARKLKNSKANPSAGFGEGEVEANAAARHDASVRATAGAETVPAVVDSSGEAIENVSPLDQAERQAAKEALR